MVNGPRHSVLLIDFITEEVMKPSSSSRTCLPASSGNESHTISPCHAIVLCDPNWLPGTPVTIISNLGELRPERRVGSSCDKLKTTFADLGVSCRWGLPTFKTFCSLELYQQVAEMWGTQRLRSNQEFPAGLTWPCCALLLQQFFSLSLGSMSRFRERNNYEVCVRVSDPPFFKVRRLDRVCHHVGVEWSGEHDTVYAFMVRLTLRKGN